MNNAERNKHLRELANEIAAVVAPAIGLPFVPKCYRITNRRGRGSERGFSVPHWAAKVTDYFFYYVAHEVCHASGDYSHGPGFKALEAKALSALGLVPVYENAGRGPYIEELRDISGKPLVRKTKTTYPVPA